jgi:pyruvate dehydrogenase E2 component (dihydrolipoamide acetyltransferase)
MTEFRLPELGEGVNEGELVKWCVKAGETIKDDQPLCEVMTDKATIEIPSPFSGVVKEIFAKEGEIVKVHQLMISVETQGGSKSSSAPAHAAQSAAVPSSVAAPKPAATVTTVPASANAAASPSTRRFANEKGVALSNVPASGPHGRVLRDDVERFLQGSGNASVSAKSSKSIPQGQLEERVVIRGMRKKISEKMRLSKDKAAHFTYVEEADATELVRLRNQAKVMGEKRGIKVTYLPFILKSMVAALKQHPRLNSTLDEANNEYIIKRYYNISISVQTEDGLTVPVIKNVDQKSIFELASEIADVVERARKKKLTAEDFSGSTMTLTNAGSIGGLFATPIINYPEVAILGFNKIFRKPVVRNVRGRERLAIRDWTYFSISLDHRIIDGAEAAEFMKTFISYIENPALLMVD